ncbi:MULTISPECIES: GNAT family N-acetyltransferase [Acinetobacter]|jgi:ribosomal protein S18 acetylase RimI-like enzyme|uniref:GNAT family N-acetyltransferase n=1 Tax=Acinetobacter TaxID=469 RepID=UPI00244CBA69|nr:GNAT family N-acetyltransferase [Acinetobacter johnsonii]MDH1802462.1 GNAT family N-acetyltransferase [Acinetobacter johnsonii]
MDLTNFREANFKDIPQIVDLVNISYRSKEFKGWTSEVDIVDGNRINSEQVKELFKDESKLFVMFENQELIGCVHIQKQDNSCYIGMLTTHPKVQNLGIGKKILKLAEDHSIKNYAINLFEMSVLSVRKELINFYERRGYKLTGESEPYPINANVGTPLASDIQVLHLVKEIK